MLVLSCCFKVCRYIFLSADINKFLWMVRIGGSTERGQHIKENDYYTPQGEFRVDKEGSPILLNCLMYKMCYHRFGLVYTESGESQSLSSFLFLSLIILFLWLLCCCASGPPLECHESHSPSYCLAFGIIMLFARAALYSSHIVESTRLHVALCMK